MILFANVCFIKSFVIRFNECAIHRMLRICEIFQKLNFVQNEHLTQHLLQCLQIFEHQFLQELLVFVEQEIQLYDFHLKNY